MSAGEKTDLKHSFWSAESLSFSPVKPFSKNMVSLWRKGAKNSTKYIVFCGLNKVDWKSKNNLSFDTIENPYLLFNSLETFLEKLGMLPSFPHRTSKTLFENHISFEPQVFSSDNETFWKPFIKKMESEIQWIRKPTEKEKDCKFVHAFDRRKMFVDAARNTYASTKDFTEIENINFSELPKNSVGLFEVENLKFSNDLLTEIFAKQKVFYSPYLELFKKYTVGEIKIKSGYLFKDSKRIFEAWAKFLGDAIVSTRSDAPELVTVNDAAKNLYTHFIGWFGRLENRDGYGAELFRPDWRGLIISNANANLMRNILKIEFGFKKLPFAIYHDCLMYFSNSENPTFDFNSSDLLDESKFTHEYTLDAKTVIAAIEAGATSGDIDILGKEVKNGKI